MNGFGINIHTLIHEINHMLSKELILYDENSNTFESRYGFRNEGDLFYEIINDYMSKEIYNKFNFNKVYDFNFVIDRDIDSSYLDVDNVCDGFVKKIYIEYKDYLKTMLINGDGSKFIKILGKKNYVKINFMLECIRDDIKNFLEINKDASKKDFSILPSYNKLMDTYLEFIRLSFEQYDDYNKKIEEEIIKLETNVSIRRI